MLFYNYGIFRFVYGVDLVLVGQKSYNHYHDCADSNVSYKLNILPGLNSVHLVIRGYLRCYFLGTR